MLNNDFVMEDVLYILGIGGNTIVTIDLAEACGFRIGGLYHYEQGRTNEQLFGHNIIGSNEELFSSDIMGMKFALSMGDNDVRADLFRRIKEKGGFVPLLIHPSAVVSKYAICCEGVQIHANCVVDPDVIIGEDTLISAKSTVIHGCRIGQHCFLAPDAVLGARTIVDDFVFLGLNSTIISTKAHHLAQHAVIGAGSVVTKTVSERQIVAGVPARVLSQ